MILNLAFVKEDVARDLVFGAGMSSKVKQHSGANYGRLEDA